MDFKMKKLLFFNLPNPTFCVQVVQKAKYVSQQRTIVESSIIKDKRSIITRKQQITSKMSLRAIKAGEVAEVNSYLDLNIVFKY